MILEKKMGLLEQIQQYTESDMYPFHMPGHKRQPLFFPNPYSIDITEIHGFDNLHHAEGILKESMERAAEIYGADRTYYLVNGSTCGLLSAIFATVKYGGRLLLARNCHLSAYHAVLLHHLEPEYIYPNFLTSFGINGEIEPDRIRHILAENRERAGCGEDKKIEAVLIVSPSYEGIVSDVGKIAEAVHAFQIPLIVDEAHGAHLPFAPKDGFFPASALSQGADIVIQSLHKTLPSFTQTALLHLREGLAERETLERYLRIFQSSSPSYLFMAGMEHCIRYMEREGRTEMLRYEKRLSHFYEKMHELKVLRVLEKEQKDPSKLVISTRFADKIDGEGLGRMLRERFHLEMELCAPEYVLAMTSLMDTDEGFLRLGDALLTIDGELADVEMRDKTSLCDMPPARLAMPPFRAIEEREIPVPLEASEGRISKEFVFLYPPGIPILTPGEEISREILSRILFYKKSGLPLQGLSDRNLSTILTLQSPADV